MDGIPTPGFSCAASARTRIALRTLLIASLLVTAGCSSQGSIKQALGRTLQAVGLDNLPEQEREVTLRLYAGDNLNTGEGKRALSLVVRVYQLRNLERFEEAPFDVFLDQQRERDVMGDDLIGVTEVLLAPGQRHEVLERLPDDGRYLGVVALFRSPAQTRWRFAFDADEAAGDGVIVGLHGCAMTTPSPALETALSGPSHSLASSHCTPPQG